MVCTSSHGERFQQHRIHDIGRIRDQWRCSDNSDGRCYSRIHGIRQQESRSTRMRSMQGYSMYWLPRFDISKNNGNVFLPGDWYSVHDNIWDKSGLEICCEGAILPELKKYWKISGLRHGSFPLRHSMAYFLQVPQTYSENIAMECLRSLPGQ